MNASMEHRPANLLAVFLAGLQAGMAATFWMLAWLGVSAIWQRRSFWSAVNLMASVLAGNGAIRNGFAPTTLGGIALYLLIYSLLGAVFALMVRDRFTRFGKLLLGIFYAVGWYYLWFRELGQTLMPLVWLLHAERATVFGHVIFGALLPRFPSFLPVDRKAAAIASGPVASGPTARVAPEITGTDAGEPENAGVPAQSDDDLT